MSRTGLMAVVAACLVAVTFCNAAQAHHRKHGHAAKTASHPERVINLNTGK